MKVFHGIEEPAPAAGRAANLDRATKAKENGHG
ncbi:hypothetical protein QBC98_005637 [Kitasatospora acidiphila]